MQSVEVVTGRRTGRLFAYLRERIPATVRRHGSAEVMDDLLDDHAARALANELQVHCCSWRARGRYEFRTAPFPKPLTPLEQKEWEVIR